MAHLEKYTRATIGLILGHDSRQEGDNIKRSNEKIDKSRTHLNYNLATHKEKQIDFINRRTSEVKCLKRDDVNVMCSWLLTLPKDFQGDEKAFFEEGYRFMAKRYGEENVISAWVHLDETTPHMHFKFVPVVDGKKGKKVSAKERCNRQDLMTFHTDLKEYLEDALKCPCNVLNGATINGNRTMTQLKLETEQKQLNSVIEQKNNIIKALDVEPPKKILFETEQHYQTRINRETANNLKEQELYQKTQELDELQRKLSIKEQEINSKSYLLQENMQKLAKKQKQFDVEVANKINQLETEYQQKAEELNTKFNQEVINKVKEIQLFNAQTLVIDSKFAELQNQLYAQNEEVFFDEKEGYDYEI